MICYMVQLAIGFGPIIVTFWEKCNNIMLQVTILITTGNVAVEITATQTGQRESTERSETESESVTVNEEIVKRNTTEVAAANVKI